MTPEPGRKTIMVIEDDYDIRDMLCQILEDEGYIVRSATNGLDALKQLRTAEPPGLILLDLMMPVMNGWEFAQKLKEEPALSQIPFIIISADNNTQANAAAIRAAGYLSKPLKLANLFDLAQQYCG